MGFRPRGSPDFEAVRTAIGTTLRSLHSHVLNAPLPERIAELVRQLDQQLSQLTQAQQKDADST
jgi:Anti-sigma factor NepR